MGIRTDDLEIGAIVQADEIVRRTEADMAAALCRTHACQPLKPGDAVGQIWHRQHDVVDHGGPPSPIDANRRTSTGRL